MKQWVSWIVVGIMVCCLSGFSWGDASIVGDGKRVTESRELAPFHEVSIAGHFLVTLTEGSPALEVTTDTNLQPYITTSIMNDTLYVSVKTGYGLQSPVQLVLSSRSLESLRLSGDSTVTGSHLKKLSHVEISGHSMVTLTESPAVNHIMLLGSGELKAVGLKVDQLTLALSGSPSALVSGVVNKLTLNASGSAKITANQLVAQEVSVQLSGSGEALVRAEKTLEVDMSGSGRLIYAGHPQVTLHVTGSGELIAQSAIASES